LAGEGPPSVLIVKEGPGLDPEEQFCLMVFDCVFLDGRDVSAERAAGSTRGSVAAKDFRLAIFLSNFKPR